MRPQLLKNRNVILDYKMNRSIWHNKKASLQLLWHACVCIQKSHASWWCTWSMHIKM